MSTDRIDPQGGWFDLGDRHVGKLPDNERVLEPRSSESAGMQPRKGSLVTRKVNVNGFEPYTETTTYIKILTSGLLTNCVGCESKFVVEFSDMPAGSRLVSVKLRGQIVDDSDPTADAVFNLYDRDDVPNSNFVGTVALSTDGTGSPDYTTHAMDLTGFGAEGFILRDGHMLIGELIMTMPALYVGTELKVLWLEYRYIDSQL